MEKRSMPQARLPRHPILLAPGFALENGGARFSLGAAKPHWRCSPHASDALETDAAANPAPV
jgi:hypothetical protein